MFGSALRMGNAATISRDKFVRDGDDRKLELRTAKTGVSVFIPLQKQSWKQFHVCRQVSVSGESTPVNCASVWQKAYRKPFKHAGITGHPHRFRHTFAKNPLFNEAPLETVSLLLGHRKPAITEKHYARFVPERQALVESQVRKTWARVGHAKK